MSGVNDAINTISPGVVFPSVNTHLLSCSSRLTLLYSNHCQLSTAATATGLHSNPFSAGPLIHRRMPCVVEDNWVSNIYSV